MKNNVLMGCCDLIVGQIYRIGLCIVPGNVCENEYHAWKRNEKSGNKSRSGGGFMKQNENIQTSTFHVVANEYIYSGPPTITPHLCILHNSRS